MANVIIDTAKAATIAYNEKNWDKARAVLVEKAIYDEKATGRRLQGVNQIIEAWQGWAKAIPDSKARFVAEYASGDTAVLEVIWKGVHTGPLQMPTGTIPASNKSIEIPACQVVKVAGGQVQSFTHYFDMVTLLTQIGAFKG
jgi:steroid delta-isomerase-like uncharacterized protein